VLILVFKDGTCVMNLKKGQKEKEARRQKLEMSKRTTKGIPLGHSLPLTVTAINWTETLKARQRYSTICYRSSVTRRLR
jgi:hypothetical protein